MPGITHYFVRLQLISEPLRFVLVLTEVEAPKLLIELYKY